jgi:hypothetical protein
MDSTTQQAEDTYSSRLVTKVESSLGSDFAIEVKIHNIAGMLHVVRPLEIESSTIQTEVQT